MKEWRGYKVFYCHTCQRTAIKCSNCIASSCNGLGEPHCTTCRVDLNYFNKHFAKTGYRQRFRHWLHTIQIRYLGGIVVRFDFLIGTNPLDKELKKIARRAA